jgi:hypothetical protein
MKKLIIILSLVAAPIAVLALTLVDTIPPRSLTATRMMVIKRRVMQYAHAHSELPHSMTGLPVMQGYDNSIRDGWGRDITLEVSSSGIVTLRSLGRDGVVGGSGEDADMIASFPAHDSQGGWSDEMIQWSHDPFSR